MKEGKDFRENKKLSLDLAHNDGRNVYTVGMLKLPDSFRSFLFL